MRGTFYNLCMENRGKTSETGVKFAGISECFSLQLLDLLRSVKSALDFWKRQTRLAWVRSSTNYHALLRLCSRMKNSQFFWSANEQDGCGC